MISWKHYRTITYKSVDLELTAEQVEAIKSGWYPESNIINLLEYLYQKHPLVVRDNKINTLLNDTPIITIDEAKRRLSETD